MRYLLRTYYRDLPTASDRCGSPSVDPNFKKMFRFAFFLGIFVTLGYLSTFCASQDILGCGGFVKSEVEINFSLVEVSARWLWVGWAPSSPAKSGVEAAI